MGVASLRTPQAQGIAGDVSLRAPVEQGAVSLGDPVEQGSVPPASNEDTELITAQRATEINEKLKDKPLDEVLQWLASAMPGRVVQFSSFSPSAMVLLDRTASLGLFGKMPVVMIDTLHLFPETYAFVQNVTRRFPDMQLHVYRPHGFSAGQKREFDEKYGADLWTSDYSRYAYLSKVEPTARALDDLKAQAWITGRRRSQGGERKELPVVEWDNGRLKVNPLVNWTYEQVWDYIKSHHLPYNPLHDRGYPSIGDTMTTRPVAEGQPERAGRFDGNRTECGMHAHNKMLEDLREEAREHGVPFVIPTLKCDICQEVNPGNFWELVIDTKHDMLLEFYSPFCGHCHHMAPIYEEIGKRLRAKVPEFRVARMDIISYDIPLVGKDAGFRLDAYPTLYLVRPATVSGKLQLERYSGWNNELDAILSWLKKKLPYLPDDL